MGAYNKPTQPPLPRKPPGGSHPGLSKTVRGEELSQLDRMKAQAQALRKRKPKAPDTDMDGE